MKKLVTLVTIAIISISCNKVNSVKDNLENQEFTTGTIKKVFDEVSKIKISDLKDSNNNVIYIHYLWDSKNKKIIVKKIEEGKGDFLEHFLPTIFRSKREAEGEKYSVSCTLKDKDGWSEGCSGGYDCYQKIKKCLEQGGCATICENEMVYVPQTNSFFLNIY